MIRLTKESDYGILLLAHLTQAQRGRLLRAVELGAQASVPLPMVSKILKRLVRAGLLVSQRGARGGYRLSRDAESISVVEVIEALEGPISLTECVDHVDGCCSLDSRCLVRDVWHSVNVRVRSVLETISLAEMVAPLQTQPTCPDFARAPVLFREAT